MNKTLSIELSDQRDAMAQEFRAEMYNFGSGLWMEHENSCEYLGNPEEHCDCTLMDCFNWIKKWCNRERPISMFGV